VQYNDFRDWVRSTPIGHVVAYGAPFSVVMFSLLLVLNYQQGTLTLVWAIYLAFMVIVVGAVLGIAIWYGGIIRNSKRGDR
jgi:hypothetical protein